VFAELLKGVDVLLEDEDFSVCPVVDRVRRRVGWSGHSRARRNLLDCTEIASALVAQKPWAVNGQKRRHHEIHMV
jgi:hypothetical protein